MTNQLNAVAVNVEDRIAWVSFNRPEKRNCMSPQLNREMMRVLDYIHIDADAQGNVSRVAR